MRLVLINTPLIPICPTRLWLVLIIACYCNGYSQKANATFYEGPTYGEIHRTVNKKHKYVGVYDFQKGAILHHNTWYKNLLIKYNTYEGLLLIKHPVAIGAPTVIVDPKKAKAFKLGEKYFIYLWEKEREEVQGYFEVLASNSKEILYKKHRKKILRKQANGLIYYEFKEAPYYLNYNGKDYVYIKKLKPLALKKIIQELKASKAVILP